MLYFLKNLLYNNLAVSMTELGCTPITGRHLSSGQGKSERKVKEKC